MTTALFCGMSFESGLASSFSDVAASLNNPASLSYDIRPSVLSERTIHIVRPIAALRLLLPARRPDISFPLLRKLRTFWPYIINVVRTLRDSQFSEFQAHHSRFLSFGTFFTHYIPYVVGRSGIPCAVQVRDLTPLVSEACDFFYWLRTKNRKTKRSPQPSPEPSSYLRIFKSVAPKQSFTQG